MDTPNQATTMPQARPQNEKVIIDRDGDLTILVGTGNEEREFFVCSRALSRASPVFQRMFNAGFLETRPSRANSLSVEPWIINLPDDSSLAAEQVFYIVHSCFSRINAPKELSQLHSILVFTEKYDMTASLQYFAKPWMSGLAPLVPITDNYYLPIGIAWELGDEGNLALIGRQLVLNCEVDSDDNLICPPSSGLDNHFGPLIPPGLLENVAEARQILIQEILTKLGQLIHDLRMLVQGQSQTDPYCTTDVQIFGSVDTRRTANLQTGCHAMSLGVIVGGLGQAELNAVCQWDINRGTPSPVSYPYSVHGLVTAIKTIRSNLRPSIFGDLRHDDHGNPLPKLLADIQQLLDSQKPLLSEEHILYMTAQRKRLGGVVWEEPTKAKPVIESLVENKTTNGTDGFEFSSGPSVGTGGPPSFSSGLSVDTGGPPSLSSAPSVDTGGPPSFSFGPFGGTGGQPSFSFGPVGFGGSSAPPGVSGGYSGSGAARVTFRGYRGPRAPRGSRGSRGF